MKACQVLILIFLIAALFAVFNFQPFSVSAAFPGWENINIIYYNPAEDDATNKFLEQAANELLKTNLEQVGKTLNISTTTQPSVGIFLKVDANLPELLSRNEEASKLFSDANGIYITGKTPLAVRHGAYTLLEKLGFRWFFAHPVWTVAPSSLAQLDGLNETQEPAFVYRRLGYFALSGQGLREERDWQHRNRIPGAAIYDVRHAYDQIIPKSEFNTNPEWFCPEGGPPTQLKPTHPDVVARAKEYALNYLAKPREFGYTDGDYYRWDSVSVAPNDGFGFCGEYTDFQKITDDVYYLANEVAKAVAPAFPDKYVLITNYSFYTAIPSFNLEPNLIVPVTTGFNYSGLPFWNRVQGIKDKGAKISIYDYFYYHDTDLFGFYNKFKRIKKLYQMGGKVFIAENFQDWGRDGTLMYAASKILWNPSLEVSAILEDFYTKSFGPAKEPMKKYYERWHQDQSFTERTLALALRNLNEAEGLAQADAKVLERIRQVELYTVWLSWGIKSLGTETERTEFKERIAALGIIDPFYNNGYKADPPFTPNEVRQWMDKALAAFSNVQNPIDIDVSDPRKLDLRPLGNQTSPKLPSLTHGAATFLILGEIGKQANVKTGGGSITLEDPDENVVFYNTGPQDFNYTFTKNGLYKLKFYKDVNGWDTTAGFSIVEVNGAPTAIWAYPYLNIGGSPWQGVTQNAYFYVSENTPGIVLTITNWIGDGGGPLKLYNPRGEVALEGNYAGLWSVPYDFGVRNPEAGLWRVEINQSYRRASLSLIAPVPLLWTDPESLLVLASAAVPPPFSISNLNRLYLFGDRTNLFQVSGSFNLSDSFSLKFNQGTSTLASFTLQPKDSSTIETNLTTSQLTPLAIGFYDLVLERISDSYKLTYAKKLLITKLGDLWSQTATETAEQKRDGKINIYDASRMLSKWGSTLAADLAEADINSGPGGISAGRIDLYDANLMMRNWNP